MHPLSERLFDPQKSPTRNHLGWGTEEELSRRRPGSAKIEQVTALREAFHMSAHSSTVPPIPRSSGTTLPVVAALIALTICGTGSELAAATSCESLASLTLPNTTIATAQTVAAGAFQPPAAGRGRGRGEDPFKSLPAFCRVEASVKRAGDTDVNRNMD